MLFMLMFLILLFYSNFISMILISELILSFFFIMMVNSSLETINFSMLFISIMIIESCLGIYMMFDYSCSSKMFFLSNSIFL